MLPLETHFGLKGRVRWSVIDQFGQPSFGYDQDGRQIRGGEWHTNLITKLGMNYVGTTAGTPARAYLHVGEGASVVDTDSGAVTASQGGTTVTASVAIFAAGNVGDLILWDTGETALISAFTDTTHVEVTKAATVASGLFTIKHTGTIQLVSETDISNSNGGFGDANSVYIDGTNNLIVGEYTTTRVVTAPANRNYTEFGFSPDGVATHLHIFELFRDGVGTPITLTIPSGKKLRVDHTLIKSAPWSQDTETYDLQSYDLLGTALSVTAATNASPIQVTTNFEHGLATGNEVNISGVLGNTAANGIWTVTVIDATNFTLDTSVGNGAYTSGGTVALHVTATGHPATFQAAADDWGAYMSQVLNPSKTGADPSGYDVYGVTNNYTIQSDFTTLLGQGNAPFQGAKASGEGATGWYADAYVTDSMERTKGNTLTEAQAGGSNIHGFALAYSWTTQAARASKFVNPAYFAKAATNTLKVRWRLSWWWSF